MGAVWFLVSAPLLVSALPNALQPAGGAVASGTLPNLLIQYGKPRTATTLQFQTLCAIALVLNKADLVRTYLLTMLKEQKTNLQASNNIWIILQKLSLN